MSRAHALHPADVLAAELKRRDPHLAETILATLTELGAVGDNLDTALWGSSPADKDVLAAAVRNEARLAAQRDAVLADSLSRTAAARRLGITPQQVSRLVDSGDLVALTDGRELRLPDWQFQADAVKGRLEGVATVAATFPGGPVTLSLWMRRPNPMLGGRTPVVELIAASSDADVQAVADAARRPA